MDDIRGYAGSNSYKYIEPILRDKSAKLLIISPYIDIGYAKMLVKLAGRKQIRVITSRYSQPVRKYIADRSRALVYGCLKVGVVLTVFAIIALYFSFYDVVGALGAAILIATVIGFIRYLQIKGADIEIRTSYGKFVHEKAYISNSIAAIGSANLTYNGLKKNVERVEVIRDLGRISALRSHFFDLWKASR